LPRNRVIGSLGSKKVTEKKASSVSVASIMAFVTDPLVLPPRQARRKIANNRPKKTVVNTPNPNPNPDTPADDPPVIN
jgi:hypothetical protein